MLNKTGIKNAPFVLVVRDPYKRFESYYKDKVLRAGQTFKRTGVWQQGVRILFPFLDINDTTPDEEVARRIESMTLDQLTEILPDIYLKDGHLQLQSKLLYAKFSRYSVRTQTGVSYDRIFKMESHDDKQRLADLFDLDLSARSNSTSHQGFKVSWSEEAKRIVRDVYASDFSNFEYPT